MIEYKLHSEYLEMNEWEYVYAKTFILYYTDEITLLDCEYVDRNRTREIHEFAMIICLPNVKMRIHAIAYDILEFVEKANEILHGKLVQCAFDCLYMTIESD